MPTEDLPVQVIASSNTILPVGPTVPPWGPGTPYTTIDSVRATGDWVWVYIAQTDGLSGDTEPVWPTVIGEQVLDNEVLWETAAGAGTLVDHDLLDGQRVQIGGDVIPAPLVADTDYFVRDAAAYTFKLAATAGGAVIDITDDGWAIVYPHWIVEKPGLEEVPLDAMAVEEGVTGLGALLRKRLRFVGAAISEEEISDKTIIDVTPVVAGYAHLGSANVFTVSPQTFQGAAVGTSVIEAKVTGDVGARFRVFADGKREWGLGDGTFDTGLERSAAGTLRFTAHLLPEASGTRDIGSTTFRVRDVHAQKVRLESALGDKVALYGDPGAAHYGFGVQSAALQQFVNLSTSRHVWGYGYSGSLTEWMRLDAGKLGLGATTLLATLTARSTTPTFRWEDSDITIADFSGVGFVPALGANTIGQIGFSATASGGSQMTGFTSSGTNNGAPLTFGGYHGGTVPTTPAVSVYGYRHNGTTNRTALSGTEPIFAVLNAASGSSLFSILGSGALLTTGALTHSGTTIGFFGVTPAVRASAYTATNAATDRSYNADATTVDELADVLGTLISDLRAYGLVQ